MYAREHDYGWKCLHQQNLVLGKGCDIGCFTFINAKYGVIIGKDVQIGSHCSIYSENTEDKTKGKIIIKEGTKIGTHSTIMPNITIGKNVVVGAYSFVTKSIPDNAFVVGVPAKIKEKTNDTNI